MSIPTLIGAPFDGHSSFRRGAAAGPSGIRDALNSSSTNSWTEKRRDVAVGSVVHDAGDIDAGGQAEDVAIDAAIDALLERGGRPVVLGGDHSITYPIVRAIARRHGPLHILHFDAHADLYLEYDGDRFSHACPFARILEAGLAASLTQVGIRTMNDEQFRQVERFGVEVIDMAGWHRGRRPAIQEITYLSIDLDAFDPAFAPGVAHREAAGLAPRDVIDIIQSLPSTLRGADVVELNPACDPLDITSVLAAKLVKEIVGKMLED